MSLNKLWFELEEWEKEILLYLAQGISPVSIDLLCMLSARSPVEILTVMDKLKKKKVVCEKKECPKGTYFLCESQLGEQIREYVPEEAMREAVCAMIRTYHQFLDEGHDKDLALAKLYLENGECPQGLSYVRNAADFFLQTDQPDKALAYYDYLVRTVAAAGLNAGNAEFYLSGFMGKIETTGQWIPVDEIVSQVFEACAVARRYRQWQFLARAQFELIWRLLLQGDIKKAAHYVSATMKLAERLADKRMVKMAAMWQCEIHRWRGEVAEGVRRYEESVEKLETFGDDKPSLWAGAALGLSYVISGRAAQGLGMIEAVRLKTNLLNIMSRRLVVFVDRMLIVSLLEIRRLDEAKAYVDAMLTLPDRLLGFYMLRELCLYRAYFLCGEGKYREAFDYHVKATEYMRYGGFVQQKFPWSFEYMDILEKQGFIHGEMNYDGEVERVLRGHDIYMKGVGLRYRALRSLERHEPCEKVLADLHGSESLLERAGAEIELARTRIALGRAHLKTGDAQHAQSYLEKAWMVFSKIDIELFPKELLATLPLEKKNEIVFNRIIAINKSLGNIREKSTFLNQVISAALDFTMTTRGALFSIGRDREPCVVASRNMDPLFFTTRQFKLIKKVVALTARTTAERIVPGPGATDAVAEDALAQSGTTSFICMPARQNEAMQEYLYLDNKFTEGAFSTSQLLYLRLLCSQMAVGLSNIEAYEAIRETKDRYQDEAVFYKREMGIDNPIETIVGTSTGITTVKEAIRQAAPTDISVLVMGETGVGKELVAKAIHNLSNRKDGPFIPVNLAAIPSELFVSELFGHEKGAFTGAGDLYKGRFELAHGGTIFLDEIGDLPLHVQVRLLRVLQEGSFERLGSSKAIRSDFRVVAATNKDLAREVEKGTFRQDLYYRLNVFPIQVPPLRERLEDIRPLAQHFLVVSSQKMRKKLQHIPADELRKLMNYNWPGNVRELKHTVERAVVQFTSGRISFTGVENAPADALPEGGSFWAPLADMEREYIEKVLNATRWRVNGPKGAALILGLKPVTLFARMKKLGISRNK
ncbi:sigma 54-interacting transcriptional regulator [Geobacter sp. FeAm09]|uniref:sigma 54-interacting transcriptional regulator n=1 Tax=Geobacter sp. FeAm09 TaxID=2597769 RepID=UPI00143D5C72|nr:sigma 54-interacting transcriptional regulator [Geobacter sp. FeAm09]